MLTEAGWLDPDQAAELRRERDRALEEVRGREESQIPMIPRVPAQWLRALEEERDELKRSNDQLRKLSRNWEMRYLDSQERLQARDDERA
jgi:hypothetical protein